jgi:multidrug efflux pump subunit AcrB
MDTHQLHLAGRISHFFSVNRPLSILLLVVALVFGLVSFFLTPKQYNPEITRPAFIATVAYDGASIDGAIDRVVYELVEKVSVVPGVEDIYTEVTDGASITTTVIFSVGYDATKAKLDLRSQLEQHSYLARGNITAPSIIEINPETIPILQIVFGSSELSISELRERVVTLSHQLGIVPEVSELQVYGGYAPALVVEADPVQLAAAGITLSQLQTTLQNGQRRSVTSTLRAGVYAIESEFDAITVSPDAVGDLLVSDGVRVRDVARVYEGVAGKRSYVWYTDVDEVGEVIMLSVAKREGASAPVVSEAVRSELAVLMAAPDYRDISYEVVGDDGVKAQAEIVGLTQNLITSIAIVALVLLLFLSTRAALVVLVAIPLTLLLVFGLGLLFGQTINRITLFALILSLGLLVDSAIVATENIYAHLRRWRDSKSQSSKEAVIATAIDEVGVGLLLSTITSVIVFLPMNFITGMMGPYMGPIAFFVPAALIISFLVAIVVTPFIASHVLDQESRPNTLSRWFGRVMEYVVDSYEHLLRSILTHQRRQQLVLRGALLIFLVSLILPAAAFVHFQMLPRADMDQFYVYLDLPIGTGREETREVAAAVTEVVLRDADVLHVQQFVATPPIVDFNGMFKGAEQRRGAEQATLRVNLLPKEERVRSSTDVVTAIRGAVAVAMPEVASHVRLMEEPPGPPVRATFVAKVTAVDRLAQSTAAAALATAVDEVEGVVDVYESEEASVGRVSYQFDQVIAAEYGISATAAEETLALLGGTVEVGEYLGGEGVEYTPVVLRLPALYRTSPELIDALMVPTALGEQVPLRTVLTINHELRPSKVYFEDVREVSYVTAEVEGRSIVYVVIELMRRLAAGELTGYEMTHWNLFGMELTAPDGALISLSWGGEWEMTLENFRDLGIAMGVALLMVYTLLVAQYRAFNTPAYILVTVPLGLVGILWGFLILDTGFGVYLTATALIGFIALIGIVVNNAIIYLEYVEQTRSTGVGYEEALVQAGRARLRPILLTSLTTILGSLTIAGDPVWSGLAWAIVFGLSLSTVLTLIIYPTLLVRFVAQKQTNQ